MAKPLHWFRIESHLGEGEVRAALTDLLGHPQLADCAPGFELDWHGRRLTLSGGSRDGVERLLHLFRERMRALGAEPRDMPAALPQTLPPTANCAGRHIRPVAIAIQDAPVYAQLMAAALGELGLKGIEIQAGPSGSARIGVPPPSRLFASQIPWQDFLFQFPRPRFIDVIDEGE